jgi:biotin-dependent carboxylase-like uncharacterized protein
MSFSGIEIIKAGVMTTIQDGGRLGYRKLGIPTSGFMDSYSAKLANWLVDNELNAPIIEMIQTGSSILFHNDCSIALTGADFCAKVADEAVPRNETIQVKKGSQLTFGKSNGGNIAYLAISGKIQTSEILGSQSTYIRMQWGGINGTRLEKGNLLPIQNIKQVAYKKIPEHFTRSLTQNNEIRFTRGPEYQLIKNIEKYLKDPLKISTQSDRMGFRLESNIEPTKHDIEIKSSPVVMGTVQFPPDGKPIILMADGQTTGGYPRIATVAHFDLSFLAQRRIGDSIKFKEITNEEALHLYQYEYEIFEKLKAKKNLT